MVKLPTSSQPAAGNSNTYPVIPNNKMLNVVVEKCELREINKDFREKYNISDTHEVNFMFRVTDGEYGPNEKSRGRVLFGTAKPYINDSDNCRLRIWAQELRGEDALPEGYEFDTDDMVGRNARVLVGEYTKQNGNVDNKIKEVLRAETQPTGTEAAYVGEPF